MAEPQYAILRFAKYKGPEIGKIEAHNERTKEKYASLTGRTHIPPRIFREAVRLTKQQEMLTALLSDINPLNARKRAAEIEAILKKYIPGVEKMRTQLKKYDAAYKELKAEADSSKRSVKDQMEIAQKLSEYEDLRRTVDAIPEDQLAQYRAAVEGGDHDLHHR